MFLLGMLLVAVTVVKSENATAVITKPSDIMSSPSLPNATENSSLPPSIGISSYEKSQLEELVKNIVRDLIKPNEDSLQNSSNKNNENIIAQSSIAKKLRKNKTPDTSYMKDKLNFEIKLLQIAKELEELGDDNIIKYLPEKTPYDQYEEEKYNVPSMKSSPSTDCLDTKLDNILAGLEKLYSDKLSMSEDNEKIATPAPSSRTMSSISSYQPSYSSNNHPAKLSTQRDSESITHARQRYSTKLASPYPYYYEE